MVALHHLPPWASSLSTPLGVNVAPHHLGVTALQGVHAHQHTSVGDPFCLDHQGGGKAHGVRGPQGVWHEGWGRLLLELPTNSSTEQQEKHGHFSWSILKGRLAQTQ